MKLTNADIDDWLVVNNKPIKRLTEYKGMNQQVGWACTKCEYQWSAIPSGIYYRGSGCPNCAGNRPITNDMVDASVGHRNIRRLEPVVSNSTKIWWQCVICSHEWQATPSKVMNANTGCPKCANRYKITNTDVDERCSRLTVARLGEYVSTHTKIKWKCNKCMHVWLARPSNVLSQHTGCPNCRTPAYSKKAISWLMDRMLLDGVNIQHAENGGEYTLPGTTIKVDGFARSTNTVYEFYGNIFHGNPTLFDYNDQCSPYHNMTAGELYQKTIDRETRITELGYNIITIWESEYDRTKKATRVL